MSIKSLVSALLLAFVVDAGAGCGGPCDPKTDEQCALTSPLVAVTPSCDADPEAPQPCKLQSELTGDPDKVRSFIVQACGKEAKGHLATVPIAKCTGRFTSSVEPIESVDGGASDQTAAR